MIRDTFETNPGLSELFKRKIIERARFVGLSEGLIDFEAQIDKKGTYQDNLRTFYREYPQLTQNSDYFRIASIRPLSGAALEQAWRSFQENSRHETTELIGMPTEQSPTAASMLPQLVLTYSFGESITERNEGPKEPEPIPNEPTLPQAETNTAAFPHGELVRSILDRVSAMAGEKVTRAILHQVGLEIGRTEFNYSRDRMLPDNAVEALDHVLSVRGWGRVQALHKTDHGSRVTYDCSIKGCSLCYKRGSTNPTCGIMRGLVSHWLESYVQKNAESTETACDATGSQLCVVKVTFRK
jgi:predicted hydrocarbon binding protein